MVKAVSRKKVETKGKPEKKAPAPKKGERLAMLVRLLKDHGAAIINSGNYWVAILEGKNAMTIDLAKKLIGWRILSESESGQGGKFHLRNVAKEKVLLEGNSTNRPFRPGLAKRYMSEKLRKKWFLNGETIIFDEEGMCQSGQHRFAGFILGEEVRLADIKGKKQFTKYWSKEMTDDCVIFLGISSRQEVVESIDQGQKRTLGDILYRDDVFTMGDGEDQPKAGLLNIATTDKMKRKLSNILAGTIRLVWLRSRGQDVSDAPHFPPSEALEFLQNHPKLKDAVLFANYLEGGGGSDGGKITSFLSLAYCAGLYYLMSASATEPEDWMDKGADAINFKMEKKATEFWKKFASGEDLKAGDPILVAREILRTLNAGSGEGRDEIVGVIIKAFNAWVDGTKVKAKDLRLKRRLKDGQEELAEEPRLGGMDVEGPAKLDQEGYEGDAETAEQDSSLDEREGERAGKHWAAGDRAWVKSQDKDGEHYFGTIDEIVKHDKEAGGGTSAVVTDDNGKQWIEPIGQLQLKYPGA